MKAVRIDGRLHAYTAFGETGFAIRDAAEEPGGDDTFHLAQMQADKLVKMMNGPAFYKILSELAHNGRCHCFEDEELGKRVCTICHAKNAIRATDELAEKMIAPEEYPDEVEEGTCP